MKQHISALLLIAMLASLASCGGGTPAADTTAPTSLDTTTAPAETELTDHLPDKDYGGAEVNLLVRTERLYYLDTEENGDVFDDAVYARNRAVEERFNVKLNYTDVKSDQTLFVGAVQSSVMAGDEGYDIIIPDYHWGANVPDYMVNLRGSQYLDFDKPWWSKAWNDASDIGTGFYSCVGYYCLDLLRDVEVTYFNKTLIDEHQLENPYDLVNSGKWTFDKAIEMGKSVARDVNGDTLFDENDAYAMYMNIHSVRGLYAAMGAQMVVRENGELKMHGIDDEYVKINDIVYNLRNGNNAVLYRDDSTVDFTTTLAYKPFNQNNLLFTFFALTAVEAMRQTDVDFGIVPVPTLNEGDPIRVFNYGCSTSCIPVNAPDTERSEILLEALNYQSWKDTIPVYYERVLKGKLARDDESEAMLDLIFENVYFDTGFVYNNQLGRPEAIHEGTTENIVSYYDSNKATYETMLAELIALYSAE